MKKRDIYIVRHGNTFDTGDVVTRVGARTDLPLSRSGMEQAQALAGHLAMSVAGYAKAWCSPLLRTRQTAEIILGEQADAPVLETLAFLREIDYGPDENQPESDVVARIGEAALARWETHGEPPHGWEVNPKALIKAWQALFHDVAALPLQENETDSDRNPVLVVTSNGVARFALAAALGGSPAQHPLKLKTGAYGVIRTEEDGLCDVIDWNIRP